MTYYYRYDTAHMSLGLVWYVATDKLAALLLPGETMRVDGESGASSSNRGPMLRRLIAQLDRYFAGQIPHFDYAILDFQGLTDFRSAVYRSVFDIPWGQTRAYADVARDVGSPGASRAVGTAMADNPFPVIVPCHRVVGADGRLGGYRGGQDMKSRLLALEDLNQQDNKQNNDG